MPASHAEEERHLTRDTIESLTRREPEERADLAPIDPALVVHFAGVRGLLAAFAVCFVAIHGVIVPPPSNARRRALWQDAPFMDAIGAFWTWWPSIRSRLEQSIESGETASIVDDVTARVRAIDPDLAWEIGKGVEAPFGFCLSGEGDASLRRLAERWLERAPRPDGRWEFHPARPPHDGQMKLEIFEREVDLSAVEAAFELDEARERVDVQIWHPAFATLAEEQRLPIAFLALDGLLGEDGVERWLGGIDAPDARPAGSRPLAELLAAVEALAQRATGERFALLQGDDAEGRIVFASVNLALKRIDYLMFDMHVSIVAAVQAPTPEGMPTPEESQALDVIEDDLFAELGDAAAYYGRVTCGGTRTWHFFAAEGSRAAGAIERWAGRHPEQQLEVRWARDEAWEALQMFG